MIKATDPQALPKLQEQLEQLEAKREPMKAINRAYKQGGWQGVTALGLDGPLVEEAKVTLRICPFYKKPFPTYMFQNLSGNIRRIKKRIAEIEAKRRRQDRTIEFEGGSVEEDVEADRIRLRFDRRLSKQERREHLSGFRFSRTKDAFQLHLNTNGRFRVEWAVKALCEVDIDLVRSAAVASDES